MSHQLKNQNDFNGVAQGEKAILKDLIGKGNKDKLFLKSSSCLGSYTAQNVHSIQKNRKQLGKGKSQ